MSIRSSLATRSAALRKLALAAFCVLGFTLAVMAQKPYPVPAAKDRIWKARGL